MLWGGYSEAPGRTKTALTKFTQAVVAKTKAVMNRNEKPKVEVVIHSTFAYHLRSLMSD
jgi:hypothetical protein